MKKKMHLPGTVRRQALLLITVTTVFSLTAAALSAADVKTDTGLAHVLGGAARYCAKLKGEIFHFACDETILETGNTRETYHSLYQIIKIGDQIEEKRTFFDEKNGNPLPRGPEIRTKLYSYQGALTPIYFLSSENQARYRYQYRGKDRVLGVACHCLDIQRREEPVSAPAVARIWIEQSNFSVVRFELTADTTPGFAHIINYAKTREMNYSITDVHDFAVLHDGIRFPSKTVISVTLTEGGKSTSVRDGFISHRPSPIKRHRIKTVYKYENYRFFSVNVEKQYFIEDHSLPE